MSDLLERLETLTYSFDGRAKMREIAKAEVLVSIATIAEQGAEIDRLQAALQSIAGDSHHISSAYASRVAKEALEVTHD